MLPYLYCTKKIVIFLLYNRYTQTVIQPPIMIKFTKLLSINTIYIIILSIALTYDDYYSKIYVLNII